MKSLHPNNDELSVQPASKERHDKEVGTKSRERVLVLCIWDVQFLLLVRFNAAIVSTASTGRWQQQWYHVTTQN